MAQGLDVSEKRDLWVPAVLLLGGIGTANAEQWRTVPVQRGDTVFSILRANGIFKMTAVDQRPPMTPM